MPTTTFDAQWSGSAGPAPMAAAARRFRRLGALGVGGGAALALLGAAWLGLPLRVVALAILAGIAGAAASAWIAQLASGRERLVYYREAGAALAGVAFAAMAAGEPVLPYLDLAALALALVGALGRLGCLAAGCCHGRPAAFGVVYGTAHVAEGFPAHLAGARLLPVQGIEAALQALITGAGAALLAAGPAPGTTAASCALVYAAGRLVLEHWRGDDRPHVGMLSAAQWVSGGLATLIMALEVSGLLAFVSWHAFVALAMAGALVTFAALGLGPGARERRLLRGDHLAELAALVMAIAEAPPALARVVRTSAGLMVSGTVSGWGIRAVLHFTFSDPPCGLAERTAQALAEPVLRLFAPGGAAQLVYRPGGIAHLIIPRRPAAFAHCRPHEARTAKCC